MEKIIEKFDQIMTDVKDLVSITNKSSVLVIQQFPVDSDTKTLIPAVRESISNILAFIELGNAEVLTKIANNADGFFDFVVFDSDLKCQNSAELIQIAKSNITKSRLFFYSDNNTWADAAIELMQQLHNGIQSKKVLLSGTGNLFNLMSQKLKSYGADVMEWSNSDSELDNIQNYKPDIIAGASVRSVSLADVNLACLTENTIVFDVGIGNFSEYFITNALKKNARVLRVDIRAGISSAVLGILETDYLIKNILGKTVLNGIEIVAGGMMGNKGAIIVDDINHPGYIIGIADGKGHVVDPAENDLKNLEFVQRLISGS